MKKIILVCMLFVAFGSQLHAQSFCNTNSSAPDLLQQIAPQFRATASSNYVIRIFVHVMKRSNGTGGLTPAEVTLGLNTLVADLAPHGICVSLKGQDEIWNDSYYGIPINGFGVDNNNDGKFDNFSPNSNSDAVDIYLFGRSSALAGGAAPVVGATAVVVGGQWRDGSLLANSHVLSHEFGHCMGLYHTFHGLCESGTPELVNGSNCITAGDFVCDTYADPSSDLNVTNCTSIGTPCLGSYYDANGDPYNPTPNMIMDYIPPSCMNNFTNGQGFRMLTFIANYPLLQAATVPNSLTLNLVNFPSGTNRIYDVLNDITAQNVIVYSGAAVTLRGGVSVVLSPGFEARSGSEFGAKIDEACSSIQDPNAARKLNENTPVSNVREEKSNQLAVSAQIYPNPVTGVVNITLKSDVGRTIEIKAVNSFGVVVKSKRTPAAGSGIQNIQWDLSGLPQGVYILQITDGVKSTTSKIVKSK